MEIGGLQKLTLIDFRGEIACTVFLTGCCFRCPFCYNAQIVLPEKIKNQPKIAREDFFSFLKERKDFLEAVVISGGEPTVNEDLEDFCREIRMLNFKVKLDTNGFNPGVLKSLIEKKLVDYVALDVKAPPEKYGRLIGVKDAFFVGRIVKNIGETLRILQEGKIDFECRTTFVPGLLEEEDVLKIARWISPFCRKYFLQNFRAEKTLDPVLQKMMPFSPENLLKIQRKIAPLFEVCQIR